MTEDVVDALIIDTVAWSLADTSTRIMCMEQGNWMNPAE